MSEKNDFPSPLPWSVAPLKGKYYGTEILDANGDIVSGIKIWIGLENHHDLSPREQVYEDDPRYEELSHRESIASYGLVSMIVDAVNNVGSLAASRDHWKANHDDQVRIKRDLHAKYDELLRKYNEAIAEQADQVKAWPSATEAARPWIGQSQRSPAVSEGFPPGSDCACGRYQDERHKEGCVRG